MTEEKEGQIKKPEDVANEVRLDSVKNQLSGVRVTVENAVVGDTYYSIHGRLVTLIKRYNTANSKAVEVRGVLSFISEINGERKEVDVKGNHELLEIKTEFLPKKDKKVVEAIAAEASKPGKTATDKPGKKTAGAQVVLDILKKGGTMEEMIKQVKSELGVNDFHAKGRIHNTMYRVKKDKTGTVEVTGKGKEKVYRIK